MIVWLALLALLPGGTPQTSEAARRAAAFRLDIDAILAQPRRTPPSPARSATRFVWPVTGRILRGFGTPSATERRDGVEIAARPATPVHAAAAGVVAYAGANVPSLGGVVIVRHADGWASVYAHVVDARVRSGEPVRQGETLAHVAGAGSGRPALHFELRRGRVPVDPLPLLPAPDGP